MSCLQKIEQSRNLVSLEMKKKSCCGMQQEDEQQLLGPPPIHTVTVFSDLEKLPSPLMTLSDEYHHPSFKSAIATLGSQHSFTHWRGVRGDGNCFYRAFAVGYLEFVLKQLQMGCREELKHLVKDKLSVPSETVLEPELEQARSTIMEWALSILFERKQVVTEEKNRMAGVLEQPQDMREVDDVQKEEKREQTADEKEEGRMEEHLEEVGEKKNMPDSRVPCEDGHHVSLPSSEGTQQTGPANDHSERVVVPDTHAQDSSHPENVVAGEQSAAPVLYSDPGSDNNEKGELQDGNEESRREKIDSEELCEDIQKQRKETEGPGDHDHLGDAASSPHSTPQLAPPASPASLQSSPLHIHEFSTDFLVRVFRWFTARGMQENWDLFSFYVADGQTMEDRIKSVLTWGQEAEHLEIIALTEFLKKGVVLFQVPSPILVLSLFHSLLRQLPVGP